MSKRFRPPDEDKLAPQRQKPSAVRAITIKVNGGSTIISTEGFTSPEEVLGFIDLRMNPQALKQMLVNEWMKQGGSVNAEKKAEREVPKQ